MMIGNKQMARGVLWEEALGKLRAIDHTFYGEKKDFADWLKFRKRIENDRNDNEIGGF
jgi:hypothetical protein